MITAESILWKCSGLQIILAVVFHVMLFSFQVYCIPMQFFFFFVKNKMSTAAL